MTTNLRRANAPGNVLLDENEADLPKQSVTVISQVLTVDKSQLIDKKGIKLLIEPHEIDEDKT